MNLSHEKEALLAFPGFLAYHYSNILIGTNSGDITGNITWGHALFSAIKDLNKSHITFRKGCAGN
ncbi:hypothetical protein A3K63_02725 [Candidatus Micrarchaeota archaeon RBG_16_49_10]|nr:MAG: hypothetical protein A3K63_02725 [Candidatus Micrarchaeota archaeon RBG_16_49_10]